MFTVQIPPVHFGTHPTGHTLGIVNAIDDALNIFTAEETGVRLWLPAKVLVDRAALESPLETDDSIEFATSASGCGGAADVDIPPSSAIDVVGYGED